MQAYNNNKVKNAKLVGTLYFVVLGLLNFVATLVYSELGTLDFIVLSWSLLPLLLPNKIFIQIFGVLACFIALYMGAAGLLFNLNPKVTTSQLSFFMGYLLAASLFTAGSLLVYAGFNTPNKQEARLA